MCADPILRLPDFSIGFVVHCDASDVGLGAVLSQIKDSVEYVVCFASKSLSEVQRRYSITDRECLAIQWAVNLWKHYLLGKTFTVVTDHQALKWLFSTARRDPHRRHARMILDLQQFDFTIVHRDGKLNGNADALSRLPELLSSSSAATVPIAAISTRASTNSLPKKVYDPSRLNPELYLDEKNRDIDLAIRNSLNDSGLADIMVEEFVPRSELLDDSVVYDTSVSSSSVESAANVSDLIHNPIIDDSGLPYLTLDDLKRAQAEDAEYGPIRSFILYRKLPLDHALHGSVKKDAALYEVTDNGVLTRKIDGRQLLVIPPSLQLLVLQHFHDEPLAGHLGRDKTYQRIVLRYWWSHIRVIVDRYVESCESCQRRKTSKHFTNQLIGPPSIPSYPFEKITIDVLGPLPLTARRNRFCLCVMDQFTRFPMIFAIPNQKASTVATILLERVFLENGFPAVLLSDRGSNFVSELITALLALFKVRKLTTLAYRPQANGLVERFNHTLVSMISHFVTTDQRNWDMLLPYVLFAFRSAPQSTMKFSPFYLLYGREPSFPLDHAFGNSHIRTYLKADDEAYLSDVVHRVELAKSIVNDRLEAVKRSRNLSNSVLSPTKFAIDDKVMKWQPQVAKGQSKKFAKQWHGPFMVVDVDERFNTYAITPLKADGHLTAASAPINVAAARLKRYFDGAVPQLSHLQPYIIAAIRDILLENDRAIHSVFLRNC